jgi:G3E family GTPase
VLTKTELAGPTLVAELRARLAALTPGVALTLVTREGGDLAGLFQVGLFDPAARTVRLGRWLPEPGPGAAQHSSGIAITCIRRTRPLSRAALGQWLARLTQDFGERLLRLKGVVDVSGSPGPLVVQAVHHRLYPPLTLGSWPDADRRSRLVCVLEDLNPRLVEALLEETESWIERRPAAAGGARGGRE